MEDRRLDETRDSASLNADFPVSAARPLCEFCIESVGDDVVLFDAQFSRYHTINNTAFDVWRLCDGRVSVHEIAEKLAGAGITIESVNAAVGQLGESGLLSAPETEFDSALHRRQLMKLVAAGVVGTVGIPVVASITRLGPEAAATHIQPCLPKNADCVANDQCCSHFCQTSSGKCKDQ